MYEIIFLSVLGIVWLGFASVCDLRKNEIPNWISFSLVAFALGFRFFYSLFSDAGFGFFYMGLIGGVVFYGVALLFYYGRMYAGGDAKLLAALGTVLPFSERLLVNLESFVIFILLFLSVGGVYGLIWSLVLSVRHFKKFRKEFVKQFRKNRRLFLIVLGLGFVLFLSGFYDWIFFYSGGLVLLFVFLYLQAKAVEEVCMVRLVAGDELVEGDWLYEDVKIGRKIVKAGWEGLEKKDIELIRKAGKKVKVKFGIPFVPVFLIGFLILFYMKFKGVSFLF